mmetsp:Transcript_9428/g.16011  ORF Transcript_9428/g.16011 Transcript_9428/m.16011 type:complete len:82 (+) Transcript_9428:55-300(+)
MCKQSVLGLPVNSYVFFFCCFMGAKMPSLLASCLGEGFAGGAAVLVGSDGRTVDFGAFTPSLLSLPPPLPKLLKKPIFFSG